MSSEAVTLLLAEIREQINGQILNTVLLMMPNTISKCA